MSVGFVAWANLSIFTYAEACLSQSRYWNRASPTVGARRIRFAPGSITKGQHSAMAALQARMFQYRSHM